MVPSDDLEHIIGKIARGEPVRKRLAELGRLHIDRRLPFLCVYRRPAGREDSGTGALVRSEASYLSMVEEVPHGLAGFAVRSIVEAQVREFGAFMLIEVWASRGARPGAGAGTGALRPVFTLHAPRAAEFRDSVEKLAVELKNVRLHRYPAEVRVVRRGALGPPGMKPLLRAAEARALNCLAVGLEVDPVYQGPDGSALYPLVLRSIRRGVSRAFKRTFHHFLHKHTTHTAPSYHALGRRAITRSVWEADRRLAKISDSFDFLLHSTPLDVRAAWDRFKRSGYRQAPVFHYRPLPVDPALIKRELFKVPIERIEDPTLEHLFVEKLNELDQQLTMLMNIGTPVFFYGSMQLYGEMEPGLKETAVKVLRGIPAKSPKAAAGLLDARAFASIARREIRRYRGSYPKFAASVEIRDDLYAGVLASMGRLLVGKDMTVSPERSGALINHEVGTHLLTYYNGLAQPLRQLHTGLAGYDEMQEGLAVLAEYLTGALTAGRLRVLAARVVAVDALIEGGGFVDVFRLLSDRHGFERQTAFQVAMRVFRGGGLTKDFVYLQGLGKILEFISRGGELEPLYIGKIATRHIPLVKELLWREVLRPVPLRPRFLDSPESRERLEGLRKSDDPMGLVLGHARRAAKVSR